MSPCDTSPQCADKNILRFQSDAEKVKGESSGVCVLCWNSLFMALTVGSDPRTVCKDVLSWHIVESQQVLTTNLITWPTEKNYWQSGSCVSVHTFHQFTWTVSVKSVLIRVPVTNTFLPPPPPPPLCLSLLSVFLCFNSDLRSVSRAHGDATSSSVDYHWKIMSQGLSFNFSLCGFDALHLPERFSTFALIVIFCDCVHSFLLHRSTWTKNILSLETCRQVDSSNRFNMKWKNIGRSQPLRVKVLSRYLT